MELPALFANLGDVIQVVIFLIIMGAGAFFQLISAAAEKKKQEAAQKNKPSLEENLMQGAAEVVQKPRKNKREALIDAAVVNPSPSRQKKPLRPQKTAISSIPTALSNSEKTSSGLAVEIHQLLHDPQSIRQAIILSEVLTRKHF